MQIPTEGEWRDASMDLLDLDVRYAHEQFGGKDLDAAFDLFVEDALSRKEDLMSMPARCLRFYVRAYIAYLLSNASKGDPDGAIAFFSLIESRVDEVRAFDGGLLSRVAQTLRYLCGRQEWFDASPEIYGSFRLRAVDCLAKILPDKSE